GPHGIPLLVHAKLGGVEAKAVFDYLQGLGGADGMAAVEIGQGELEKLAGVYRFGGRESDEVSITLKGKQLSFTRKGASERPIFYVGDGVFRPAGAPRVRIRFGPEGILTVEDGEAVVKGRRR